MSEPQPKPIPEYELVNARQVLRMIISGVKSGKIDAPFVERQLEAISHLIERLEIAQKGQMAAWRFQALYNVSRSLGASLELQTVLDEVMDAIIQLTGAERGFLMLRDDDGGLKVKAARNLDQQTLGSQEFNYSRTIANRVLDTGEALVTTNASEDPRFAGQMSIVAQSLRSIMATPLKARGSVIGVAYVDSRAIAGLFNSDDLATLEALSAQASVAIDNAMLFSATDQQLAARVEELRQLRRIDRQLNETLDAEKTIETMLEWACRLGNAQTGFWGLLEGVPPQISVTYQYQNRQLSRVAVLDTLFPQVSDALALGQARPFSTDEAQLLIVPVLREHKTIGALVLWRAGAQPFSVEEQDLVERLAVRSAVAIENGQLYAAVQQANRAKSEFVGVAAHELKTPMTSIAGYAELMVMQGGNLTERQVEFLKRINATVKRMELLVSDLADVSRIESGHFFMNEIRTSVGEVIAAVKDTTLPEILHRGHTLIEDIEQDLPDMWVDYFRLVQVLTNLISNAYKYTPNGGVITLSAKRDGERIAFAVADSGIGLSAEAIRKLGTKFWRSEDEYTRSQPGTGLGFAITSSLVEQMGSAIHIESAPGKGSRFSFSVAIAPAD